jgi:(S)-3,5-dihydroxyphenylglycine transaminase
MILEKAGSLRSLERDRSTLYRENLLFLLNELKRQMPKKSDHAIRWNTPNGGFFVCVKLPIVADQALLEYCASEFGVLWTPMSSFYLNKGGTHELRLSCSYLSCEQIKEGVGRLARFFNQIIQKEVMS